jgi:hypothetical protein
MMMMMKSRSGRRVAAERERARDGRHARAVGHERAVAPERGEERALVRGEVHAAAAVVVVRGVRPAVRGQAFHLSRGTKR